MITAVNYKSFKVKFPPKMSTGCNLLPETTFGDVRFIKKTHISSLSQ